MLCLPDVSCATDDTKAALLTSVHSFFFVVVVVLKLFTFCETFHSYLMNSHTMGGSALSFSVLLSELSFDTLLYKAAG